MRKRTLSRATPLQTAVLWKLGFFLVLVALVPGAKCPSIPEMQDIEVTVVVENCIELTFEARGSINTHSDTDTIDVLGLRDDLVEAGFDIAMIDSAWVTRVLYGVVAYNETPTDREIVEGEVSITREDDGTSQVLFNGLNVEVYPLLGLLVPAPVEPGGVDFVNDLLADVIWAVKNEVAGQFLVAGDASGDSEPQGRYTDFDWRVRIYFQIAGRMEVEVPSF